MIENTIPCRHFRGNRNKVREKKVRKKPNKKWKYIKKKENKTKKKQSKKEQNKNKNKKFEKVRGKKYENVKTPEKRAGNPNFRLRMRTLPPLWGHVTFGHVTSWLPIRAASGDVTSSHLTSGHFRSGPGHVSSGSSTSLHLRKYYFVTPSILLSIMRYCPFLLDII